MNSTIDEKIEQTLARRSFITKIGAAGIGIAAGASTVLVGCGGSSHASGLSINSSTISSSFHDIMTDEDNHVALIAGALGGSARPAPTFVTANITAANVNAFISDAAALENTGTGAYLYFANNMSALASSQYLQTAAGIAIVEGRHAGFLNALRSYPLLTTPSATGDSTVTPPNSVEVPQAPDEVNARAAAFIAGVNLNGGPAPLTTATAASASVVDILNYALLLEYLEKAFYDLNVPRFFS